MGYDSLAVEQCYLQLQYCAIALLRDQWMPFRFTTTEPFLLARITAGRRLERGMFCAQHSSCLAHNLTSLLEPMGVGINVHWSLEHILLFTHFQLPIAASPSN